MSTDLVQFEELRAVAETLIAPVATLKVTDAVSGDSAAKAREQMRQLSKKIEAARDALVRPLNDRVKEINNFVRTVSEPLVREEKRLAEEMAKFAQEQEVRRQAELRRVEEERRAIERKAREEAARIEREALDKAAAEAAEARRVAEKAAEMFGEDPDEASVKEQAAQAEEAALARAAAEAERLRAEAEAESARKLAELKAKQHDAEKSQLKGVRKKWCVRVIDMKQVPREFIIETLNEKMAIAARESRPEIPGLEFYQDFSVSRGRNSGATSALLGREE